MTMATNASPGTGAKLNRQQRRQAARLAKGARGRNGAAALSGTDAVAHKIEIAAGYLRSGDVRRTRNICKRLLTTHPNHPAALHVMGMAAMKSARILDAVDLFRRAIAADARNPRIRLNLGSALAELGRFDEAAVSFREAISLEPGYAWAHAHLGKVLRAQGRTDEAVHFLRQAVKISPKDPSIHCDLGGALGALGESHEAIQCYLHALSIKPDFAKCRRRLATALKGASFSEVSEPLLREIEACLSANDVDKQTVVKAALSILKLNGDLTKLLAPPYEDREETIKVHYRDGALGTAMDSVIFRLLLRHTVMNDPDLEISLTALRKVILIQIASGDRQHFEPSGEKFRFLCALAEQCFNNEYVYSVSDDERRGLDGLEKRIETGLDGSHCLPDELQVDLVCLSMYKPLHALNGSKDLPRSDEAAWKEPARRVAKKQLDDCDQEKLLAKAIQPIAIIRDAVSIAVKEQYEESPYPRWLSADFKMPKTGYFVLKALFPHFTPPEFLNGPPQILVAGCGTGKHALVSATRFLDAEVLAVDLSATSLAYGIRMARELGVTNVQFRQGDILSLSNLDKNFEIIECSGVLHHMEDPIEGWKTLVGLLQPSGLMKVGLYSQRARDWMGTTQERQDRNEIGASADSIRRYRHGILRLPSDDPKAKALGSIDFHTMSGCRDLLFHVQEHRFTIPQLDKILDDLGLRFLGFELENQALARSYRALFPVDVAMTDLRHWNELEAKHPNAFSGMYQFWCQKI